MKKLDCWHVALGLALAVATVTSGILAFLALHYAETLNKTMERPIVYYRSVL